tara:strand:+ start:105 stop:1079 length:975 start_codon:yes stop_codon:yes gene_type:complete
MNFTEEEIKFMQKLRTKEMGYGNIARRVETVYRKKPTVSQVKEALATPKQKQAKTEIAAIPLPESLKEVVELRKKGVTYKEITNLTGFPYRQVRSICSVFVLNNSEISRSNMVRYKAEEKKTKKTKAKKKKTSGKLWSSEEEAELVSLREQGVAYAEIAKIMGRTAMALQQRFSMLKKTNQLTAFQTPVEVIETVEEPTPVIEKKWANNRCNYSPQEELGILVDFHNLSIDQMREKYQRDYRALAGRYEDIWDSEEPSRIALVMEASRIVAARQQEEAESATEPRMGWFERRKMRRVARKAAKIQKRLDRMATKYGAILTNGDE